MGVVYCSLSSVKKHTRGRRKIMSSKKEIFGLGETYSQKKSLCLIWQLNRLNKKIFLLKKVEFCFKCERSEIRQRFLRILKAFTELWILYLLLTQDWEHKQANFCSEQHVWWKNRNLKVSEFSRLLLLHKLLSFNCALCREINKLTQSDR